MIRTLLFGHDNCPALIFECFTATCTIEQAVTGQREHTKAVELSMQAQEHQGATVNFL